MSVLALLLLLLLSMVNGATRLWKSNENRVDSYREARAAINLIARDLTSIYTSSKPTYFYTQDDPTPVTPVTLSGMDGRLFFLTSTPSDAQGSGNKSDLCTVGYYMGFGKTSLTGKGAESYNLYRYFRGSDGTFSELSRADDIASNVHIDISPTAGPDAFGASSEVLAKNITGFEIKAYTIPPPITFGGPYGEPVAFRKKPETPLPDMLEITIKALNNEAAKRFTKANGTSDKDAWEDPGSRTRTQDEREFTTRVYLAGATTVRPTPTPSPSPSSTP